MRMLPPLIALILSGCASRPGLRPFTTDGCSLFSNGTSKDKTLWLHCCEAHDHEYWLGGTKEERRQADLRLRDCVSVLGHPKTGAWMRWGARVGGAPYLPTPFRWGYGWPYPRGYKSPTEDEVKRMDTFPSR